MKMRTGMNQGMDLPATVAQSGVVRAQKTLLWDGPNLKVTSDEDANQYLRRDYRKGWSL